MSAPPDLVLLHGFAGSSASWGTPVLEGLSAGGRAPVLFDLPGHGRHAGDADPAHHTLEHVLAELDRALTPAEAQRRPVDLIGYSMGGRLALAYAVRHPERVRRLVLESASPGLRTEGERAARREADGRLAERLERDGIEAFVAFWEELPLFASRRRLPAEVRALQRTIRLRNDSVSLAASLRGLGTGSLPSLWDGIATLEAPTLLVVGAEDRKFVDIAREMVELLPDATMVVVPGAGHTVHLERRDAWLGAVVGFLGVGGAGRTPAS